jgi:hypothetical protein
MNDFACVSIVGLVALVAIVAIFFGRRFTAKFNREGADLCLTEPKSQSD